MMSSNFLTQSDFFETIENSQYIFQINDSIEKYVPNQLYKFSSFPTQKYKKTERMRQLKNSEIWFSSRSILNDPFEFEHLSLKNASLEAQKYYAAKQKELGLFCLTGSPLNKLMWSHYADSYGGYCVEYNVRNKGLIYPVIYDNTLPDLSESYQRFYDNKDNLSFSSFGKSKIEKDIIRLNYPLLSKDVCWDYEQEFRIIDSIQDEEIPKKGHLRKAQDYGLFISAVIIGTNCTSDNVELLKSAVKRINKERYQKMKRRILDNPKWKQKCKNNIDYYVQKLSEKCLESAPVVVKYLIWNKELQLTVEEHIGE